MAVNRALTFALAAITTVIYFSSARAQDFDGTPLASCPGYIKNHPIVSELGWSAGCLLQALHDKNKELIAALVPGLRCTGANACDGPLDEYESQLIFGDPSSSSSTSVPAILFKGTSVLMIFDPYSKSVDVKFVPRPGKAKVKLSKGGADFIGCSFSFDQALKIWIVNSAFGHFETDFYNDPGNTPEPEPLYDLNGSDSALPVLIWKPQKQVAKASKAAETKAPESPTDSASQNKDPAGPGIGTLPIVPKYGSATKR